MRQLILRRRAVARGEFYRAMSGNEQQARKPAAVRADPRGMKASNSPGFEVAGLRSLRD
jgi:hypothetical protein